MKLTRVAVTLGLAWLATELLLKDRRRLAVDSDDGLAPFPSVDTGLPAVGGAAAASDAAGATGSDSPNDAERLQASGVAAQSEDESWTGDLFKSTSQESPYARAPGLPDFARGA
jgi:hypothetical protein